jgi:hypothetical protein
MMPDVQDSMTNVVDSKPDPHTKLRQDKGKGIYCPWTTELTIDITDI